MRSLAVGALALVIAMADTAVADPETVGIVAVGNKKLTAPVKDHIASWLGQRGHEVKEGALPAGAIKTLTDCIVIDDLRSCASGVVEAQAKTDSVIYVEIRSETAKQDKELTLVLHWFAKQRVPASERRICEECTDDTLTGTLDAMLSSLETSAVASGHVKVTSKPVGLLVLIDNAALGVTPVERDVRAGRHEFTLVRDGKTVATETAKIEPGASVELTMTPTGVDESGRHLRKRVIPLAMMGVGAATMVTGAIFLAIDEDPTGASPQFRNTGKLGAGLFVGGAALAAGGAALWMLGRRSSAPPMVALGAGGASLVWARSF